LPYVGERYVIWQDIMYMFLWSVLCVTSRNITDYAEDYVGFPHFYYLTGKNTALN